MSPTENPCWRLNKMHYAMGLLPQHPHIISCAIQAKAGIEFGDSACYNVMIVIREQ